MEKERSVCDHFGSNDVASKDSRWMKKKIKRS